MNKYEALKEIFDIDGVISRLDQYNRRMTKKVSLTDILSLMSKKEYNFLDLEISAATISRLLTYLFPDRPKTREKPETFLFHKYGYKYCGHCEQVKPLEDFNKNSSTKLGVNIYCRVCHNTTNAETQVGRTSKYRAAKLNRTVAWADQEKIKEIYANCPEGMHVDHIIPLQGKLVSGLHVPENLQYLSVHDNCSKRNKYMGV